MSRPGFALRDYSSPDAPAVDALALAAFEQYRDAYDDWPAFAAGVSKMSSLATVAELIVAEAADGIVGAVGYAGPGKPKPAMFDPSWPIMRMLVVSPAARGMGVGRALAEECIARARRDGAKVFALHTSPIMSVALAMYERMGFRHERDAGLLYGVPRAVYLKSLEQA